MNTSEFSGKVMTVRGPIEPTELGTTIMHEHLFISLPIQVTPMITTPATELGMWNQQLTLDNLHFARARKPILDNWVLSDENLATEEALEFRKFGGNSIVEVTSIGIHRDPVGLLRVSNATDLNVIMGSGWYQKLYHPANMDDLTVEDMADEIVRDITEGVAGTGVRSGIIGEVGIQGDPIEPNEIKSIQASVRASLATGAAISLHLGGQGREKLQTIEIMDREGVDRSRVIFGHSDPIASDIPLLLDILSTGVYIQFDLMGRVTVPTELRLDGLGPDLRAKGVGLTLPMTALVAEAVPQLIEAGYVDRILFSQDVCTKIQLKAYGGTGYSYILETFIPHLKSKGLSDKHVNTIMVENPMRILTLSDPAI